MKCNHCGHQISPGSKFCANCGHPVEVNLHCSQCGAELAPEDKFCGKCGASSNVGITSTPPAQGHSGDNQAHGKRQLFAQKAHLKVDAAMAAEKYLRGRKLETQIVEQGGGLVVQGKQHANLLKSALGLDAAVTVRFTQDGADLFAEFGAGKWLDKVAGAAVGWFLFWPAMLTTGYGVYMQKNLLAGVEDHVRDFLLRSH